MAPAGPGTPAEAPAVWLDLFAWDVASSRGTMSMRKSNISDFDSAAAISDLCSVRRLLSSA